MRSHYDFIFSIGSACSCTEALRAAGLQFASFPFDWITVRDRSGDVRHKADAICCEFRDWFEREDFSYAGTKPWHLRDFYRNGKTGIVFNHDFPKGVPFSDSYPIARAKYDRRIRRLYRCIESSESVLLVRIDRPDQEFPATVEDCTYARTRLSEKFPEVRFDVLFLTCAAGVPYERRLETVSDGMVRMAFDYRSTAPDAQPHSPDMARLVSLLRERYSVRDYRTDGERAAERARKRLAKYRRFESENAFRYALNNLCLKIRKAFWTVKAKLAGRRRKRYDRIVPIGIDTEPAFHLRESQPNALESLFDQAVFEDLDQLIRTIADPTPFCAGELTFEPGSRMWRCANTGILVRGAFPWRKPGTPPPQDEALARDKADLAAKTARLKSDFLRLRGAKSGTLFVLALHDRQAQDADLDGKLRRLEDILGGDLLVVCDRKTSQRLPQSARRSVRSIGTFARRDLGPIGALQDNRPAWRAVFSEFSLF